MFDDCKNIWISEHPGKDEFAEFKFFVNYVSGKYKIKIFADSDYVLYVNGQVAGFGQYHGYKKRSFYDTLELTDFLKKGNNVIFIEIWHYGNGNFSHIDLGVGLSFELYKDDEIVLVSDENIFSRKSLVYKSGTKKEITMQLGYTFFYDARKEDDVKTDFSLKGFSKSTVIKNDIEFAERPNEKLIEKDTLFAKPIKRYGNAYLFDLGREVSGYLFFDFVAEKEGEIKIYYGEHITDGCVRAVFANGRDFSVNYYAKKGKNSFIGFFRRLGCRYLEFHSSSEIEFEKAGIVCYEYPLTVKKFSFGDSITDKIYQTCVQTLIACMHEHYEDCPWREQGLYTMDSRNQMLCSYVAFENANDFIKSNLRLIALGQRENGILDICYPCETELYIPSFALYYIIQVKEYVVQTKDKEFIRETIGVLRKIIDYFLGISENGLIKNVVDEKTWNFYEWNDGYIICDKYPNDLIINALFSLALKNYGDICIECGIKNEYGEYRQRLNRAIATTFYDNDKKIFAMYPIGTPNNIYSELGNAFAVLSGVTEYTEGARENVVKEFLNENSVMTKSTLSMICFKYDVLLQDKDKANFVLNDIYKNYTYMLEKGATTFWETIKGDSDFEGQASLCHGWSAMPIYYFNLLLTGDNK